MQIMYMRMCFFVLLFFLNFDAASQIITTIAGTGISGISGDGGASISARVNCPYSAVIDKYGNYYFVEILGQVVRKIDVSGIISRFAGTGSAGFSGDGGPATAATFKFPCGLAFDTLGDLYISDASNFRIRKITMSTGIISTVAGSGSGGDSGDGGSASTAGFHNASIIFDAFNNLYISDGTHHKIRKINASGIITTFAGTGSAGFSGDGGAATTAMLNAPFAMFVDRRNNLHVSVRNRIRKIDTAGIITTIAGNGVSTYVGDGMPATAAQFGAVNIAIDKNDIIYIADSNQRIRMIDSSGIIHTFAGNGIAGYDGEGVKADTTKVSFVDALNTDSCNNVYLGEVGTFRIRKVTAIHYSGLLSISSGTGDTLCVGMPASFAATFSGTGGTMSYRWLVNGINVGAGGINYTYVPVNGDSVQCIVIHTTPCFTDTIVSNTLHMVITNLSVGITGTTVAAVGTGVTLNATVTGADSAYTLHWKNKGVLFSSTTTPVVTYTKVQPIDSITATVVSTSRGCNATAVSGVHVVYDSKLSSPTSPNYINGAGVTCYPNPAGNTLYLQTASVIESVSITDIMGSVLLVAVPGTDNSIDVATLPTSMYFIKTNTGGVARFLKR